MSKLINSTNRIRLILLIGIFEFLAPKHLIDVHPAQFYRCSRIGRKHIAEDIFVHL